MVLDNGLKVRLLGVRERNEKNGDAVEFLRKLVKGQKVFLKFDTVKYDDKDRLLCYVYLKNKTFINRHLIKRGLADVDDSVDFKYKEKFHNLVKGT